jgi:hypothetical protein
MQGRDAFDIKPETAKFVICVVVPFMSWLTAAGSKFACTPHIKFDDLTVHSTEDYPFLLEAE